ncbi:hypothetical protein VIN01S_02480 [Vibrio inusitatus NBRC 102082]|uniref:Uncharacterized protein n=1 Tax=Vibrio inusitatus NBRC 102082 TaxID=1219070 RepID=A0A4Y3HT02_9VIBR|nr:hypothetical protein VIN01S_02480 [Vibrio inusitatus NBRC 102082]
MQKSEKLAFSIHNAPVPIELTISFGELIGREEIADVISRLTNTVASLIRRDRGIALLSECRVNLAIKSKQEVSLNFGKEESD